MGWCIRCSGRGRSTETPRGSTYCRSCSDQITEEGNRSTEGVTWRQRWRGYPTIECPGKKAQK